MWLLVRFIFARIIYFLLGFIVCFCSFPLHKNNFEKREESFMAGLNYLNGCFWAASRLPESKQNQQQWAKKCLIASNEVDSTHQIISVQMDQIAENKEK